MLPMKTVFDANKLMVDTDGERTYFKKWEKKIIQFIDGFIDTTEMKRLNQIAYIIMRRQHDRISAANLLWRMKNDNAKEIDYE